MGYIYTGARLIHLIWMLTNHHFITSFFLEVILNRNPPHNLIITGKYNNYKFRSTSRSTVESEEVNVVESGFSSLLCQQLFCSFNC